jgi:hypothetical protein
MKIRNLFSSGTENNRLEWTSNRLLDPTVDIGDSASGEHLKKDLKIGFTFHFSSLEYYLVS